MNMKIIAKMLVAVFFLGITNTLFAQKEFECQSMEVFLNEYSEADWNSGLLYDSKSKFFYQLANNEEYLYVHLVIKDETVQKKILAFGFTIHIDTTGKKKENTGIQFPFPDKAIQPPRKPKNGKDDFYIKKYEIIQEFTSAKLTGFEGKKSEKIINIHEADGVDIKMEFNNSGYLLYKLTVPLKMISPSFNPANNPVFSVCFETGYLNTSQMSPPPGGGSRQGPPPSQGQNNMQEMMNPSILWIRKIRFNSTNN